MSLSGPHRVRRARSGMDSDVQQKPSFCHAPTPEAAARSARTHSVRSRF
jgi:hypothetical protein